MTQLIEIRVPELGSVTNATIIEIPIQSGDQIQLEETLITLESDKASMDIPATHSGTVKTLKVKVGDTVSAGDLILLMATANTSVEAVAAPLTTVDKSETSTLELKASQPVDQKTDTQSAETIQAMDDTDLIYAGPGVRRLARELQVDLSQIHPTGLKGRILQEDLHEFVKKQHTAHQNPIPFSDLPILPEVDFAQFGPIETRPFSRIKKLSAGFLQRNWLLAPHVTQFDEADITELEAFRQSQQTTLTTTANKPSLKLTPLAFIMKAAVTALKGFPQFNASLSSDGQSLTLKRYYHIGVAVDTPEGLVVPVIRNVDQKGLVTLAEELATTSARARAGQLSAADMQGSSFTISSLGGIGGGHFTPIINLPDVAILGVSKAATKPVYQAGNFIPRLLLPIALSYDHRVIDGAEGARFITYLVSCLSDIRKWLL